LERARPPLYPFHKKGVHREKEELEGRRADVPPFLLPSQGGEKIERSPIFPILSENKEKQKSKK